MSTSPQDLLKRLLNKRREWKPRPEILLCRQIPKPMHGLAPRVVLGEQWWDKTRKEAYASTDYRCIACSRHKVEAGGWLEAHEVYEIDYRKGRMKYIETVPLCHYCHSFIHQGHLTILKEAKQISATEYAAIMNHGREVLVRAGLKEKRPYYGPVAPWKKWRLVIGRRTWKPLYKSYKEWLTRYSGSE